jgi:hypothetical protein
MTSEIFDNDEFAALPQAEQIRLYIEEGRPVNHFLTFLIQNDLMRCVGRADARNLAALSTYCTWFQSYAPPICFGSKDKMDAWIAQGGLKGLGVR